MSSILHALLISGGHFALLECRPLLDARRGNGQRHNDGRQELQALDGHDLRVEYDGVDEAVNDRAENRGDDALFDASAPEQRLADDEAGEADDDDARAGVDVHSLLILADDRAGERREHVGKAQADRDRERRIQGRGAHHVGVIARGADGKTHARAEKQHQQKTGQKRDKRCEQQLVPLAADAGLAQHREDGLAAKQALVGFPAHGHQVHGVKAGVRDDAGEDRRHAELRLQKRGDKARARAREHRGEDGEDRVSRGRHGDGHGRAEDEAAVGRQIGDVEDAVA